MTADDFREIALSMHGAIEGAHMKHPDFRANGRIFATLDAEDKTGGLKLSPEEQRELMRSCPGTFVPAAGAWGRQGWTKVQLAAADKVTVRGALTLAWQNVTGQPRPRRSARPSSRQAEHPSRKR